MMQILNKLSLFLVPIVLYTSCQCVPGLDTEQDISPSQFARVMSINCVPNQKIGVIIGNREIHSALSYDMEEGFKYFNVAPGIQNFSVTIKNDSIVYNGFAELKKGFAYSFFLYPFNKRIQSLLLNDTISNYSGSNSYFRFVFLAPIQAPTLLFQVEDQYPISVGLSFKLASQFFTTYPGKYQIRVSDPESDSTLRKLVNYQFKPGKGYSIVLRGYFESQDPNTSLNLLVIEHNFDEIFDTKATR
ncbi:MAG: hypothetical protein ACUVQ1_01805 [Candidatus Kapaibacteriales bacterium]